MLLNFSQDRWDKVKEVYDKWWNNKLERPIVSIVLEGNDPCRPMPHTPLLSQATCADFSHTPDDIVNRLDYELSTQIYLGDAYPRINLDCFGPGVIAAFLLLAMTIRTYYFNEKCNGIALENTVYELEAWLNELCVLWRERNKESDLQDLIREVREICSWVRNTKAIQSQ